MDLPSISGEPSRSSGSMLSVPIGEGPARMSIVEERLQAAWAALSAAAKLPERDFWAAFDEVETQALEGLTGQDRVRAAQSLYAYLAELKGGCGSSKH